MKYIEDSKTKRVLLRIFRFVISKGFWFFVFLCFVRYAGQGECAAKDLRRLPRLVNSAYYNASYWTIYVIKGEDAANWWDAKHTWRSIWNR